MSYDAWFVALVFVLPKCRTWAEVKLPADMLRVMVCLYRVVYTVCGIL